MMYRLLPLILLIACFVGNAEAADISHLSYQSGYLAQSTSDSGNNSDSNSTSSDTASSDSDSTGTSDETMHHGRLYFRAIWIVGSIVVGAIAAFLAWMIRSVQKSQENSAEAQITAYFTGPLKPFTHATKEGDRLGIASGRFKYNYPKIHVGETSLDVTGSVLEAQNILVLKNGSRLEFYNQERGPQGFQ